MLIASKKKHRVNQPLLMSCMFCSSI